MGGVSDDTPPSRFPIVRREIDLGAGRVSMFTLVDPDALLDVITQEEFDRNDGRMPYWGTIWPSALALAEKVLRAGRLDGRRVLDLGCGLGLVGLAALERGARVTFLDWEPEAVRLALASARANGHGDRADGEAADWRVPPPHAPFDLVLGADVLYEARNGPAVARFLADHVADPAAEGGEAWIADPGRLHAKDFLEDAARVGLSHLGTDSVPGREGAVRVDVHRFALAARLGPIGGARPRPVLLTAFEPFGGKDVNPSWEAIRAFEGTRIAGREVHVRRLPVVYGAVAEPLAEALRSLLPEIVVAFGLGKGLHVERQASNVYAEQQPLDNAGRPPPSECVADAGPAAIPTSLPVDAILAALRSFGLAAEPSDDAGGYLCNEAFFHLMAFVPDAAAPIRRRGFVHLPDLDAPNSAGGVYDLAALRRAVRLAVATTVATLAPGQLPG
jgi:pyroglutamyl-peptidase